MGAYRGGIDLHMVTAMGVFQKPKEQVTETERRYAKLASFMILYGGTEQSLADSFLNGDMNQASRMYHGFFDSYPGLKKWSDTQKAIVTDTGYVTTSTIGRYIFLGHEQPGQDVGKILRQAGNATQM